MRYLGLDLGTKTLGVALSDKSGFIASFYKNISYNDMDILLEQIKNIAEEKEVKKIILGFPKNMNNSIGERAEETILFKNKLEELIKIEVILEDERLTTKVAESLLIKADMSRIKRKKVIDGLSAVIILQSYLDRKGNSNER